MDYNYVNLIIAVVILFDAGILLSRFGGVVGITMKMVKALRCLSGHRD